MQKNSTPITIHLIDEYYNMIRFQAGSIGRTKSETIERIAKLGAQILFVENMYVKDEKKYEDGLIACNYLKNISVGVEVIPFKKIRYAMTSTYDADKIIKTKLKGPKTKVCMTFEAGFARYVNWLSDYYGWSVSFAVTLLMQHGTALTNCLKDKRYPPELLNEFEKITGYNVKYDPTGDNIILNKITGNTQINFKEINPAGLSGLQVMSKNPTNTSQGKEKEFIAL